MNLIVIVLSLLLERGLGHYQHLRRLAWLGGYRRFVFSFIPRKKRNGIGAVLALLLPIFITMLVIQITLWAWFGLLAYGLFALVLGVVVVTYCLGPEIFNELVDDYLYARERVDVNRTRSVGEILLGKSVPDSLLEQDRAIALAVFRECNTRIFGVLFWYLVLGPAGALLFRVSAAIMHEARREQSNLQAAAQKIFGLLGWIPARITAMGFFLAGSFEDAVDGWRRARVGDQDWHQQNERLLAKTGAAAMQHEVEDIVLDDETTDEETLYWVRAARGLVLRTLVVWLVGIALMTLGGWTGWGFK
ncbi:MAG: regulatory signaling modulator protein AmpE [Gammaproteobacteria bacterium]|nr:regulatory signaling modulator protein AmpE [Gammaproteobacteria bacterium]